MLFVLEEGCAFTPSICLLLCFYSINLLNLSQENLSKIWRNPSQSGLVLLLNTCLIWILEFDGKHKFTCSLIHASIGHISLLVRIYEV